MHTTLPRRLAPCALLALAAATAATATGAHAQMVVNGGFETGDFSGWSESGGIGSVYGVDTAGPRVGNYSAFFGASSPSATIWQTLATVAGQAYVVSFHFERSAATAGGSFAASLGGAQFFADPGAAFGFAPVTVQVVATSDNAVLRFTAQNPNDFYTLDEVRVSPVPEPASALLWLTGLAAAAGLATRGRQRAGGRSA